MEKLVRILFYMILVMLSFGQLIRISVPDRPIFFYAFEPLVFLTTLLMAYSLRKHVRSYSLFKISVAFIVYMFISLGISFWWYSTQENIVASLYFLRLSTYILFVVLSIQYFKVAKYKLSRLIFVLVAIWVIIASLTQYFLYQNLGNLAYLGWDPHLYRLVGLYFDPPMTVAVFALFAIAFYTQSTSSSRVRYLNWFFILIFLGLSFLTYSRGGYLGILAVCLAAVLASRNVRLIILTVFILLSGFLILPKGESEGINLLRTTSIGARFEDYQKGILIWQKSPLTGIGYNHIRVEKDPYESQAYYGPYNPSHGSTAFHSSFLTILVTGGIIGLSFFIIFLVQLARISKFFLYAVVFLSVISLFDNVFLHPFTLGLLGYLGGMGAINQSSRS